MFMDVFVKVIINVCIGLVVLNGCVILKLVVVVYGNLFVVIDIEFGVSQLVLFGDGEIVVVFDSDISIQQ